MLPPYCPEGDPEFMPTPQPERTPETVSLIHPNFYIQALDAQHVRGVKVTEENGQIKVSADDGAIGDLVNAVANAHFALIAATSHVSNVTAARALLSELRASERDPGRKDQIDDVVESLGQSIDSLTKLTPTR